MEKRTIIVFSIFAIGVVFSSVAGSPVSTSDAGDQYIYAVSNVTKIVSAKKYENIDLVCDTDLEPPVNYSWIVHTYDKSLRKIVANTKTLTVADVRDINSGIYFCKAVNSRATIRLPTVLTVEDVIPAFNGDGYLIFYPKMENMPRRNIIKINFKPKSNSGFILHVDQFVLDGVHGFASFGLNDGIPEFRYDLGTGAVLIRGDAPLQMNKWHTVVLSRDGYDGYMEIDGKSNFTGTVKRTLSQWKELYAEPFYLGGHDRYASISAQTNLSTGFKGCIKSLLFDSEDMDLFKGPWKKINMQICDNYTPNTCQNGGFCQKTTSFRDPCYCICRPGYRGDNCELEKETCYADSCVTGQCFETKDGIECSCPLGTAGDRCEKRVDVNVPAFTKNSYLAYRPPKLNEWGKIVEQSALMLKLKPAGKVEVDDGIIFYVAESNSTSGKDDFLALSIVNGYVELRFRVYDGRMFNVTNKHHLVPNEYVTVSLTMDSDKFIFSVANTSALVSSAKAAGYRNAFELYTLWYVGGYDKHSISLPQGMSVKDGFHGCISTSELSVNDLGILKSYVEAINVNDCDNLFGDSCGTKLPCENGGNA